MVHGTDRQQLMAATWDCQFDRLILAGEWRFTSQYDGSISNLQRIAGRERQRVGAAAPCRQISEETGLKISPYVRCGGSIPSGTGDTLSPGRRGVSECPIPDGAGGSGGSFQPGTPSRLVFYRRGRLESINARDRGGKLVTGTLAGMIRPAPSRLARWRQ